MAPLPRVDFPDHQRQRRRCPGASPRDDGLGGGDAARAPLRPHRRRHRDDLDERRSAPRQHHAAVRSRPRRRRRRARRAGGDQRRRRRAAAEPAVAPALPQGQPGRRADPDPLADARRRCRCPTVFDAANTVLAQKISQVDRRRAGVRRRRPAAGGARAGRSGGARRRRADAGGRAHRARRAHRRSAQGRASAAPTTQQALAANDQLARRRRRGRTPSSATSNGAAVRLGDVAHVIDDVENKRVAAWSNGERTVHADHAAPAGRQHHRRHRARQEAPARSWRTRSRRPSTCTVAHRPRADHPRLGAPTSRRRWSSRVALVVLVVFLFLRSVRATVIPRVAVPLSLVGDLRRHVPARLQPRQPVADGAHHLDRLRRRRRHRGDRERHALHRGRACRRSRRRSRAPSRSASPSCRITGVAAGGVHPHPAHGRHRRAAVPRVRGDAGDRHRRLGGDLADADADDVLAPAARTSRTSSAGRLERGLERGFDGGAERLRARRCASSSRHRFLVGIVTVGDGGADGVRSTSSCPRGSSRSRTPGLLSGFTDAPQDISFPAMKERQEALEQGRGAGSRRRPRRLVHRRRRRRHASTPAPCSSRSSRSDQRKSTRRRDHRAAAPEAGQGRRASTSSCRRCRTCASAGALARTQYQYTLQDAEPRRAVAVGAAHAGGAAQAARAQGRDHRSADRRPRARSSTSIATPRRGSASRMRDIDDTLYDAFGQRQVATTYTQLNQYRVVLEIQPAARQAARRRSTASTCARRPAAQVPLSALIATLTPATRRRCRSTTRGSSRR